MVAIRVLSVVALVTWLVVYLACGTTLMRRGNAEKVTVLTRCLNHHVVVVGQGGGRTQFERDLPGILRAVDRRGISLEEPSGRLRYIPLGGVRGLEDPVGRSIAEW